MGRPASLDSDSTEYFVRGRRGNVAQLLEERAVRIRGERAEKTVRTGEVGYSIKRS